MNAATRGRRRGPFNPKSAHTRRGPNVTPPKVFVRDSGIAHALLGLGTKEEVLGHPVVGHSWEGFVIENLPGGFTAHAWM